MTRALGFEPVVAADGTSVDLKDGEIVVLCSDGVWLAKGSLDLLLTLYPEPDDVRLRSLVESCARASGGDATAVCVWRERGSAQR